MEDRHILKLLFARAEGAIEALASKYGKLLLRICTNITADPRDGEECVSDTYLALWNAIPPAKPDPLSAYVYKTGRNVALKRRRSSLAQKRSAYEVSLEELADCLPDHSAAQLLDARELGRAIDRFLDTLSQQNRVIFLRRYWFGDSVMDLANAQALTPNALTVRLSRLRAQLKDYLIKEGFFDEA